MPAVKDINVCRSPFFGFGLGKGVRTPMFNNFSMVADGPGSSTASNGWLRLWLLLRQNSLYRGLEGSHPQPPADQEAPDYFAYIGQYVQLYPQTLLRRLSNIYPQGELSHAPQGSVAAQGDCRNHVKRPDQVQEMGTPQATSVRHGSVFNGQVVRKL